MKEGTKERNNRGEIKTETGGTDQSNQRSADGIFAQESAQQLQLSVGLQGSGQRAQTQTQLQAGQLMNGDSQAGDDAPDESVSVNVCAYIENGATLDVLSEFE